MIDLVNAMLRLIRPASRNDALHVAALVDIAGHGIESDYWSANLDEDGSPVSAARRMVIEDEGLPYHLSRAWLVETQREVAGGLVGGLVPERPQIPEGFPAYFRPLLELESLVSGYWAVIAVAVYREFRGKGHASGLLDFARVQAVKTGAQGLSIVVEDANEAAISLYRHKGFVDRETRPWLAYGNRAGPKAWLLLTRSFRAD